ncbi:HIT domain-containing protein [Rhizobium rhizogenes]|uniref:HIT domain-containing protein n=1 Tax=Rhizobium rhizogenes TaxID=359 RepID=UPI0004D5A661|nr:HIT domain-containing protein [Rhizobium rhizogenes]KEA06042.1 hydrolase [Rhizobium rhizogenes]MQB32630.1 HIT family protein [Rhizobium rhizogenes]NTF68884.1 HIT family protein [Rhizobium rhizogenes]NTI81550.1 HIT family protein [Rhizobium rhizogenes]NTJ23736.1 HIT family protein [Rhizobium rhizogenes]
MDIPSKFRIHETEHWLVNHRMDTILPGYLMVGSKLGTNALHDLPTEALASLGLLLAKVQRELETLLHPARVYIGRYGHSPGHPLHFHIMPVYDWLEALFWKDERYRVLGSFGQPAGEPGTDGAELTFFIWREFCEAPNPPSVTGPTVSDVVAMMRSTFLTA